MTGTPATSELFAKLLDLHLARSIGRLKGKPMATSKFHELAAGIKGDLLNFDQQADELMRRREDLRRRGEAVMTKHRESQNALEEGIVALERAVIDMEGSNSRPNGEGSGGSSGSSFPK